MCLDTLYTRIESIETRTDASGVKLTQWNVYVASQSNIQYGIYWLNGLDEIFFWSKNSGTFESKQGIVSVKVVYVLHRSYIKHGNRIPMSGWLNIPINMFTTYFMSNYKSIKSVKRDKIDHTEKLPDPFSTWKMSFLINTFQQLLILSNFKHFLSWNDGYFALLVNIKKHTLNKGRRCRDRMVIVFTTTLWVRISIRARCTTLCDKVCQWLATGRRFSPGTRVSSTSKTDRHDITETLLKEEWRYLWQLIISRSLKLLAYAQGTEGESECWFTCSKRLLNYLAFQSFDLCERTWCMFSRKAQRALH